MLWYKINYTYLFRGKQGDFKSIVDSKTNNLLKTFLKCKKLYNELKLINATDIKFVIEEYDKYKNGIDYYIRTFDYGIDDGIIRNSRDRYGNFFTPRNATMDEMLNTIEGVIDIWQQATTTSLSKVLKINRRKTKRLLDKMVANGRILQKRKKNGYLIFCKIK